MRVLSQRVPPRGDPDAAHRLARVQHVAETTPRGGLVHAIVLGAHCDVRLELLAHLVVRWPSAKDHHPALSAAIGSTCAARRAGQNTAASSTSASARTAASQERGSNA